MRGCDQRNFVEMRQKINACIDNYHHNKTLLDKVEYSFANVIDSFESFDMVWNDIQKGIGS